MYYKKESKQWKMKILYIKGHSNKELNLMDRGVSFATMPLKDFLRQRKHSETYNMIVFDGHAIEHELRHTDFLKLEKIIAQHYQTIIIAWGHYEDLVKADKIGMFTKIQSNKILKTLQKEHKGNTTFLKKDEDEIFWKIIYNKIENGAQTNIIIPSKEILFQEYNMIDDGLIDSHMQVPTRIDKLNQKQKQLKNISNLYIILIVLIILIGLYLGYIYI